MAGRGIELIMSTLIRPINGSCEETRDRLSDHLEGSLPPRRDRRVSRHLRYCRRCRAVYASLVRTVESVRELGRRDDAELSGSAARVVVERIRREDL